MTANHRVTAGRAAAIMTLSEPPALIMTRSEHVLNITVPGLRALNWSTWVSAVDLCQRMAATTQHVVAALLFSMISSD